MATRVYSTCNCEDSVLSWTANILSILTFAYVLVAGTVYQYSIHQRAKHDTGWADLQKQWDAWQGGLSMLRNLAQGAEQEFLTPSRAQKIQEVESALERRRSWSEKGSEGRWRSIRRNLNAPKFDLQHAASMGVVNLELGVELIGGANAQRLRSDMEHRLREKKSAGVPDETQQEFGE